MPSPIQTISFWLNAFIPHEITGNTKTLREGPYKGLTVTTDPVCYLTDQRNFSNHLAARSRMQSALRVDFSDSMLPSLTQSHRCDYTVACDYTTGEVLSERKADASGMTFSLLSVAPQVVIHMDCKSTDPCASDQRGFDQIEYKGRIEIDAQMRGIDIDLMICLFPAFEAYVAINDGSGATLFRHAPPAGILAARLPQGANRRIRSRWQDGDAGGGL